MSLIPVTRLGDPASKDRPDTAFHVVAILPTMNPYGGVISVVNLLEQLLERGHRYTIVSMSRHGHRQLHPRSEPIYLEAPDEIDALPADGDVILATSWETVDVAIGLGTRTNDAELYYFVQDIEADFYDDPEIARRALSTYERIPRRIVKTEYLQRRLADLGHDSIRVPPGMDLDLFYPRDTGRRDRPRVLAMARPGTPKDHRGWDVLVQTFNLLADERPDVELTLFGSQELPDDVGFPHVNVGRVSPDRLPALYSSADVYVDTSRHHGFGRTGVEAMACGTPCVLSLSGGVSEYATDGDNALLVPVGDPAATAAAVIRVIEDEALANGLRDRALSTVKPYSDGRVAEQLEKLFTSAENVSRPSR